MRRFLREVTGREHFAAAEAPPESVRALIARAAAAQAADRSLPPSFVEWRSRLADVEGDPPTPGDLVRRALGEGPDRPDLEPAVELVK